MMLEDKSVVITGAGSGVGRASALVFAREGAKVVVADVMEDWAKETVRLVEEEGNTAVVAACDVTKEDQVRDAIATAVSSFGRLDVMFNNAGVATPAGVGPFENYDDAQWDRLMNINLRGVFYGMKHTILQFKEQGDGGAIVNTASVAGLVGWGGTVYGVTKGGVVQMTAQRGRRGRRLEDPGQRDLPGRDAHHQLRGVRPGAGVPGEARRAAHDGGADAAAPRRDHARGLCERGVLPRVGPRPHDHRRDAPDRRRSHRALIEGRGTSPVHWCSMNVVFHRHSAYGSGSTRLQTTETMARAESSGSRIL